MLEQMSLESVISGGIGGVSVSAAIFKLFFDSTMSHLDTLKKNNEACESRNIANEKSWNERYNQVRAEVTNLTAQVFELLKEKSNAAN